MANLLIVDDTADSSEVLAKFLSRAGHDIVCASNGRDALRSILNHMPDLILLDLLMPEMDGPTLLEVFALICACARFRSSCGPPTQIVPSPSAQQALA